MRLVCISWPASHQLPLVHRHGLGFHYFDSLINVIILIIMIIVIVMTPVIILMTVLIVIIEIITIIISWPAPHQLPLVHRHRPSFHYFDSLIIVIIVIKVTIVINVMTVLIVIIVITTIIISWPAPHRWPAIHRHQPGFQYFDMNRTVCHHHDLIIIIFTIIAILLICFIEGLSQ